MTTTQTETQEFEAFVDGGETKLFATKAEAIKYVDQFEAGEVRNWADDAQVYVKFPRPTFA